jgi:hypothetical protein
MSFIPSSSGPVTFPLMYCRTGAPCTGASAGIVTGVGPASGCVLPAREPGVAPSPFVAAVLRMGVEVRAGVGLAAATKGVGVEVEAGAVEAAS